MTYLQIPIWLCFTSPKFRTSYTKHFNSKTKLHEMRKKLNSYTDRCNEYLSSELMYKNI